MLERIKRPIALILAFAVMVFCWFPTYVDAVVLEGAAILTLDLFINILIIAMIGSEMDGAFRGAAASDDMKPKDWLSLQINKYTNGEGLHEPGLLNMFQAGVKYWQDGTIVIGEQMANWITDFQNWLWGETDADNSPSIKDYAEFTDSDVLNFNGVRIVKVALGTTNNNGNGYYNSLPLYYYLTPTSTTVKLLVLSNMPYVYMGKYDNNGTTTAFVMNLEESTIRISTNKTENNIGASSPSTNSLAPGAIRNFNIDTSIGPLIELLPLCDVAPSSSGNSLGEFVSEATTKGNPDTLALSMGQGSNAGVAIGLPDSVLVGRDGQTVPADATVDIADYVSAVADAAAGVYYPTMPVAIPGEGVVDVPVSIPADTTVPIDGVDDVGVDEITGDAAGDVAGEASGDVTGTGDYTVALSDFFPFCIPFDLLAMLKKFQASAEAPKVDVPFNIQGNVTVFTIDLSPWDPVARVLRTMEKIAFAIGLAWATKNLIQGGS